MTIRANWTAVSFFSVSVCAAGLVAFAGCTVTSSTGKYSGSDSGFFDDSGSNGGQPEGDAQPNAAQDAQAPTGDAALPVVVCEGNTQDGVFVSAACQARLNATCCTELKGCFNLPVVPATKENPIPTDCRGYASCVDVANRQASQPEKEAAQAECDAAFSQASIDAYAALETCFIANASDVCVTPAK